MKHYRLRTKIKFTALTLRAMKDERNRLYREIRRLATKPPKNPRWQDQLHLEYRDLKGRIRNTSRYVRLLTLLLGALRGIPYSKMELHRPNTPPPQINLWDANLLKEIYSFLPFTQKQVCGGDLQDLWNRWLKGEAFLADEAQEKALACTKLREKLERVHGNILKDKERLDLLMKEIQSQEACLRDTNKALEELMK